MIIKIPESNYFVEVDEFNFTLVKTGVTLAGKQIGKETRNVIGYFGDFATVLRKYIGLEIIDGKQDLQPQQYVERYEELVNKLINFDWKKTIKESKNGK